jgi:hypothetical protein
MPGRKRIVHQEFIPGGKRFWKVGQIYILRQSITLYYEKPELKHNRIIRRRTNRKWNYDPTIPFDVIPRGQTFIALKKPLYCFSPNSVDCSVDESGWRSDKIFEYSRYYKLNILCGDKVGWIFFNHYVSPRVYCKPLKIKE